MNALIILFSLFIGYVFFMVSFYLLAKVLFPKLEQTSQEDSYLEKIESRRAAEVLQSKTTAKSFSFNKQPQVA